MIVAFASVSCAACKELLPYLSSFQKKNPRIPILCIMMGDEKELIAIKKEYEIEVPISPLPLNRIDEMGTKIFPFAYYLSNSGIVMAKGIVNDEEKLNKLVQSSKITNRVQATSVQLVR